MSVFKAYDVRGIYPDEIDEALVRRIGYHFAKLIGGGPIVVGRDMRPSSVPLAASLTEGIHAAGADVIDVGMVTTPMVYYATGTLGAAGGVVVTASHNPSQYNGLKFCREEAIPVGSTSGLGEVEAAIARDEPLEPAGRTGQFERYDVVPAFAGFLEREAAGLTPLKVAVDTGNGTVGPFVDALLGSLPLKIVPLFFEPDGAFPNHEANPLKHENLRDLQRAVLEHGCALGIAFDGDGDRSALVDEQGRPVPGDIMTALIARRALARTRGKGGTILYDLRSSRVVREEVEKLGGKAIETRVGHAFIKAAMREHDALFAGELSGHYYFHENFNAESSFLAAIRVMQTVCETRRPLSSLVDELTRYPCTGEINFEVADKDAAIERIAGTFADAEIHRLDGITVRYPSWWANVRKSNTEPLLRLNLEADDAEVLEEARAKLTAAIGGEVAA